MEHWDTVATIPPASKMPHSNGKFSTTLMGRHPPTRSMVVNAG